MRKVTNLLKAATAELGSVIFKNRVRFASRLSIERHDQQNIGDMSCVPRLYFSFLRDALPVDIALFGLRLNDVNMDSKLVIAGGGGIFYYEREIRHLAANPTTTVVIWGAGHNVHGSGALEPLKMLDRFKLVGIRDYNVGFEWVPCVSCMSPVFDRHYPVEREVVLYNHRHFSVNDLDAAIPRLANDCMDLEKVIAFLGSAELVLTSSYHGAYWATLLGRKVIILNPFSSKFFGLKHPHDLCSSSDWRGRRSAARSYPEALAECRDANLGFAAKVAEIVEKSRRKER